jgi:hypothetical protein
MELQKRMPCAFMRLTGENGLLELEPIEIGPKGTQSESDVLLNVTVEVERYSAADQSCWVMAEEWDRFLTELRALDQRRQGRAAVVGASAEYLRLEFYSTDSAGHMAVRGHVGWRNPENYFLQLQFGFSFEPDRLPGLVKDLGAFRD